MAKQAIGDLQRAAEWSKRSLEKFRTNRTAFINEYVGFWYSERGAGAPVPVNLMSLAVFILQRQLVAHNPRVLVTTKWPRLMPTAAKLTQAGSDKVKEIKLGETLKLWVLDALFGFGIIKVGVSKSHDVEILGFLHDVYQVYADVVSLDDWVHDMGAKRWDQCTFMGDTVRIPYELALDSGLYDNKVLESFGPTSFSMYDQFGVERTENISRSNYTRRDEFKTHVDIESLWLPQDNVILSFAAAGHREARGYSEPIREEEYTGPEGGPYHRLHFADVPDNIMPLCPASLMMDLHQSMNVIWRKLTRQAERQKIVGLVRAGQRKDGETIMNAADGEIHGIEDPSSFQEVKVGGIDQTNMGFALAVKHMFSYINGNLDAQGGLGPQADTYGQEKIIGANVGAKTEEMQERMDGATVGVVTDILWYIWNDPTAEIPIQMKIPGTSGLSIATTWGPLDREGDFLQYAMEIAAFSMRGRTPADRLQGLMEFYNGFVMPAAEMMGQQGITIDFQKLARRIAEYSGVDEIDEFLIMTEHQREPGLRMPGEPRMGQPQPGQQGPAPGMRRGGRRDPFDEAMAESLGGGNGNGRALSRENQYG